MAKSLLLEYGIYPDAEMVDINQGESSKSLSSIQDYLLEVTKGRTVSMS